MRLVWVFLLMLFISLLFISLQAIATRIRVEVAPIMEGVSRIISHNSPAIGVFKTQTEFYNIGSVGYSARIRMDIFDQAGHLFTGWSDERPMWPGADEYFNVSWYSNATGNFTARIRAYYGNEILELENISLEIVELPESEDIFDISGFRTYEDYIKFYLSANLTGDSIIRDAIVIPSDYQASWVFEQVEIGALERGQIKKVIVPFVAKPWKSSNVTLTVVSVDGRYLTTKTFYMEKETGLSLYINLLFDKLKELFFRIV